MNNWRNIQKIYCKDQTNFFIECDLEYPEELHDLHSDYQIGSRKIRDDWLSECCIRLKQKSILNEDKTTKSVTTSLDKKKYVLRARNLQLYTSLGMKLIKIHRLLNSKGNHGYQNKVILTHKREPKQRMHLRRISLNYVFGKQ